MRIVGINKFKSKKGNDIMQLHLTDKPSEKDTGFIGTKTEVAFVFGEEQAKIGSDCIGREVEGYKIYSNGSLQMVGINIVPSAGK